MIAILDFEFEVRCPWTADTTNNENFFSTISSPLLPRPIFKIDAMRYAHNEAMKISLSLVPSSYFQVEN